MNERTTQRGNANVKQKKDWKSEVCWPDFFVRKKGREKRMKKGISPRVSEKRIISHQNVKIKGRMKMKNQKGEKKTETIFSKHRKEDKTWKKYVNSVQKKKRNIQHPVYREKKENRKRKFRRSLQRCKKVKKVLDKENEETIKRLGKKGIWNKADQNC